MHATIQHTIIGTAKQDNFHLFQKKMIGTGWENEPCDMAWIPHNADLQEFRGIRRPILPHVVTTTYKARFTGKNTMLSANSAISHAVLAYMSTCSAGPTPMD